MVGYTGKRKICRREKKVLEMEFGENRWTRSTRNQVNRLSTLTRQLITLARMEESGGSL